MDATEGAPPRLLAGVFPRHRADVGNVPARPGKRFDHGNDHDDKKSEMDERLNNRPQEHQQAAQGRNGAEDFEDESGDDVKYQPRPAEDD